MQDKSYNINYYNTKTNSRIDWVTFYINGCTQKHVSTLN